MTIDVSAANNPGAPSSAPAPDSGPGGGASAPSPAWHHVWPWIRLASGPVVPRLGDVFGPPVNMAARLTAVARRNRLIIDQRTADQLPVDEFESRRLPARPVHGFGLVEPVAVRRR